MTMTLGDWGALVYVTAILFLILWMLTRRD